MEGFKIQERQKHCRLVEIKGSYDGSGSFYCPLNPWHCFQMVNEEIVSIERGLKGIVSAGVPTSRCFEEDDDDGIFYRCDHFGGTITIETGYGKTFLFCKCFAPLIDPEEFKKMNQKQTF